MGEMSRSNPISVDGRSLDRISCDHAAVWPIDEIADMVVGEGFRIRKKLHSVAKQLATLYAGETTTGDYGHD